MSLISILISGVGSGIAKGILNIWLEEDPFKREIGKNIVSIVASKTVDILSKKNITRQFDELTDKIAQNILHIFDTNENKLSEAQKKKVAILAGVAVNNLNVNSELLVINNLDPKIIERLLNKNAYIPNEESDFLAFTDGQKHLFKLVMSDSAQFIVDIASQLPSFTEKSIAEILTRQSFIASTGVEILDEVQKIRESIKTGNIDFKQYETDYRRQIVRKLDQLQLFGVDVAASSKRYKLSVAYVSLMVESKNDDDELLTIENCLKSDNKLIVKGLAGSGKTTLLQWIAIKSAGHKMPDELNDWNNCIPFFIRLREYSNKNLPSPKDFVNGISLIYGEAMPKGWIKEKLTKGQAIILIDGVDEIEFSKRSDIKEWLIEIDSLYPNNKLIVTSRPYAVQKDWLDEIGFTEVDLQEMNLSDIDSFVEHWHKAATEVEKDPDEKLILTDLESKIKFEIRHNKNLLRLATNPLLCALICALSRQRLSKLPSDRIELYNACIGMFFRRDVERKVSLIDYEDIGTKPKELILSDIAYWLIRNGWSEADKNEIINRVNKKLMTLHAIPSEVTSEGVVKYFVERSGILRHPTESKIDFPHRTFEEYFAAKAIVEEGDYGLLLANINDDQWREVIILTCGLARKNEATNIVDKIMKEGDLSDDMRKYYHLLAATCAEMVIELPIDNRFEIEKRFKKLIPPTTISIAKEISKLGELALPYLTYRKNKALSIRRLKPVMRALSFIGDEALLLLKEYSIDSRVGVQQELLEGGKYTKDPILYGKIVLSHFTKITLMGHFSLDLFTHLNKLVYLNIDVDSNRSRNIDILGRLEKLEILLLKYWRKNLLDLSPLSSCSQLNYLDLTHSSVIEISVVEKLPKLVTLILYRTKITRIDSLKHLLELETLGLDYDQLMTLDLDVLGNLPKLSLISSMGWHRASNKLIEDEEKYIVNKIRIINPNIKIRFNN